MKILDRLLRPDIAGLFARKDVDGLMRALESKELKTRWEALLALNDGTIAPLHWSEVAVLLLKDPDSVAVLRGMLQARQEGFSGWFAVLALLSSTAEKYPAEVKPVIAHLTEPVCALLHDQTLDLGPYSKRDITANVLGVGGDPAAVGPLIEALNDSHDGLRHAAMEALGAIGGARAVEALAGVFEQELERHRKDRNDNGYEWAAKGLGRSRDARAAKVLGDALRRADDIEANFIGKALKEMGEAALDCALDLLKTGTPRAKCVAAGVLAKIKGPRSVEALVEALRDQGSYESFGQFQTSVCNCASAALEEIGPQAKQALLGVVASNAPGAKLARKALASIEALEKAKAASASV